jgi:hypothetical protein
MLSLGGSKSPARFESELYGSTLKSDGKDHGLSSCAPRRVRRTVVENHSGLSDLGQNE